MMGRTHAIQAGAAGLAVAPLVGWGSVPEAMAFGAVAAGWGLVPDLDHPTASASRIGGAVTGLLSAAVCALSSTVYRATRTRWDNPSGEHRTLTHTAVSAVALGAAVAGLVALTAWAAVAVAAVGLLLAADRLGTWAAAVGGGAIVAMLLTTGVDTTALPLAAGAATGGGAMVHILGDTCTRAGTPLLWPMTIRGKRWWAVRIPAAFRVRTGSPIELSVIAPLSAVLAVVPALVLIWS